MSSKKKLYVIDGSSYLYRAFYALGRLSNSRGLPTQAIFGFAQMIQKVMREMQPDYVCMVFDAPGPTFRHELYGPYKATRQKMPEDLAVQVPYIKKLVALQGIPHLEKEGYEADDIIAALARQAREEGIEVVIVSGDKDLHQLIEDPHIRQWDAQNDRLFTEAEVKEKFGIHPEQMGDFLALMGDSSDNVPGVKGVGEKTARQLLQKWGSLEAIYENIDEVTPPSVQKKLKENRDLAFLSRKLVSFPRDAPMDAAPEELVPSQPEWMDLLQLYDELEFKKLAEVLRHERGQEVAGEGSLGARSERRVHVVRDEEELEALLRRLREQESFSVDLETSSRDSMLALIVGIALCWEEHEAFYIPLGHTGERSTPQLNGHKVLHELKTLLESDKPSKVGQNIKYEWVVFQRHGVSVEGIGFDTMVAGYLLNPGTQSHALERIAAEHLGETMISYTDVTGKGKSQVGFAEVDVDRAAEYSGEDAEVTWRLMPLLKKKLEEEKLLELYESLELPLIRVLAKMEHRGICVDADKLVKLSGEFDELLAREAEKIYDLAKEEFNIQSPRQLGHVLFEKLGLRVVKKTKTGPSTDVGVLEELALEHPIAEHLLKHRSLSKLKGTYTDSLIRLIHPETGRIHTSFNQTVTATGRLSSSDPNLQNIPIRSEEGRKIREAFVPSPGFVLLSADYSQIELRILAHYSGDVHLCEAFRAGADVHRRTAAEMFGLPPHEVTSEMRRQAKAINFGIIYGMGPFGLAQRLRIGQKMAKAAIDRYFERYEGVKRFIEEMTEKARERGYSETLMGRRRPLPELASRNRTIRQQGERLAINTPIQGTAADFIKKAMVSLDERMDEEGLGAHMLLQVHDELVFEVPVERLEPAKEVVRREMEGIWELSVPLKVEMGWGENWTEAHF